MANIKLAEFIYEMTNLSCSNFCYAQTINLMTPCSDPTCRYPTEIPRLNEIF